jgi:23S rRNA (cytidine1920-2'-O)/16S rRNA (cytidine1409-2'-O)-methyltransferase
VGDHRSRASTGGFTELLLARGARLVNALDNGRHQLEGTDIRAVNDLLKQGRLPERPDFVCVDVSFISLKLVLPPALAAVRLPARFLALIKPQFEAGRRAHKKGIVRDPAVHSAVCERIAELVHSLGWQVAGIIRSPIAGGDSNREFFIAASHA